MLKIEETNKVRKSFEIGKRFCDNISEEAESNFASLVIPKIESHHLLQPHNHSKSNNPFLTWSKMTSAAPSPPAENVSTTQQQRDNDFTHKGEHATSKNLTIECDFTHVDEVNYKHEDILMLEQFKEAIELLIVKVRSSRARADCSEPLVSVQDRGLPLS